MSQMRLGHTLLNLIIGADKNTKENKVEKPYSIEAPVIVVVVGGLLIVNQQLNSLKLQPKIQNKIFVYYQI